MEELIFKGVETVAIGGLFLYGMKEFFKYLGGRSTRNDEREKEHQTLLRENQTLQANHMNHNTDAINKLSHCIEDNTEASRATVGAVVSMTESVDNCEAVQEARERKR